MIRTLLICLGLTLVTELAVLVLLGVRDKKDLQVICCANIITNPIVVYVTEMVGIFYPAYFWFAVAVLEVAAAYTEGLIFQKFLRFDKVGPWALSIVANVVSFELGFVISYFS
ncbi:MAG: hypothetical protein IKP06_02245 [Elusimicrobiaceae bacterium]|nr:hypothetical protein [Elusimicrobiaceae bacterium]